jgi:hypothetical protein
MCEFLKFDEKIISIKNAINSKFEKDWKIEKYFIFQKEFKPETV